MGKGAAIKDMKDLYGHFNLTSELFLKRKYLKLKITNLKQQKFEILPFCVLSPPGDVYDT